MTSSFRWRISFTPKSEGADRMLLNSNQTEGGAGRPSPM
jgi:hypothetical protein